MSNEALRVVTIASWVVTLSLAWLLAYRGGSQTPKFDMWVFGVLAVLNLVILGSDIHTWVSK